MNLIGNIFWFILGGLITAVWYGLFGLLMCITIVGIPFGIKLMRLGLLALWPFGKEVTLDPAHSPVSLIFNILWIVFGWWEVALVHLFFAVIFFITIIGIPFGLQHLKLARYSLVPFGCEIK